MRAQKPILALSALVALTVCVNVSATEVAICTDEGRIVVELNDATAPLHVESFLRYVDNGHYTGTVFHRVIDDFMIQAGGFDRNLQMRTASGTVQNESRNGLSNERGTVAAARTSDPHSAAAQFFINTVDNPFLDASNSDWGYTVFGAVTEGMDVADAISALPTGAGGPFPSDVPAPLVTILSVSVIDRAALAEVDGPDLQAAILDRIDAAEETNSPAQALEWISHYRAACAPAGPDLLVTEARNSVAVSENLRAMYALEEFFATAPDTHRDFGEALEIYAQLQGAGVSPVAANTCTEPVIPDIPDGTRESLDGMLAAQAAVQAFMRDGTAYLECMDEIIENPELAPTNRATMIDDYNRMVDLTQQVGDDFNRQVRAFRARQ